MPYPRSILPPSRPLRTRLLTTAAILVSLTGGVLLYQPSSRAAEEPRRLPSPTLDVRPTSEKHGLETVVLAGGCFWGVQGVYQHTKGVTNAVSGYAGGAKKDAEYSVVGSGRTGHAEAVAVTFDPRVISYGRILQIFFSVAHDPTELNYQGPDHGPQYRTEIFAQNEEQQKVAKAYIAQLDAAKAFGKPIVTKTDTLKQAFYPAEDYHQDYATLHPSQPYIAFNDLPKIENLKKLFAANYVEKPTLVSSAKVTN
jgi:peptide-methionine (S)-S-oxide reductase